MGEDYSAMARTVLELMIERLEPVVGTARRADFTFWAGDPAAEALAKDRHESGWYRFATALLDASEAITSNDPEKIMLAALICPGFERDGLKLAAIHKFKQDQAGVQQAAIDATNRRDGGLRRGAAMASDAQVRWSPYEEMFKLLSAGKDYHGCRDARAVVKRKMLEDGFVTSSDTFPSERALRDHFPCKENRK